VSEFEAFLLGLVQGLTEFLPVSSSGHLVMIQTLLGIEDEGVSFEVAVHVATLLSVLIFYRKRIGELIAGSLRGNSEAMQYLGKLVVATIPAVLLVLLAGDFLEQQFDSPHVVGICLLLTGTILWQSRRVLNSSTSSESSSESGGASQPSWGGAVLIGCAQACAIRPGISRSGSTVVTAMALGVAPLAAAEFSFLMSIIAIAGAALRVAPEIAVLPVQSAGPFLYGGIAALVSGIGALWLFVRMMRRRRIFRYAYYTWSAGAAFLLYLQFAR